MSKLTANRVALLGAFLASLATGAAGVANTVPGQTGQTILLIAGMIGACATAITFAVGTMKFDATPVGQAIHAQNGVLVRTPVAAAPLKLTPVPVLPTAPAPAAQDPALQGFGETAGTASPPAS